MKKSLLVLTAVWGFLTALQAQTDSSYSDRLQGIVLFEASGLPAKGALVYAEELNMYVVASEDGGFIFEHVPSGTYTLHIQMVGCRHKDTVLTVPQQSLCTILLLASDNKADEIIIEGNVLSAEPVISATEVLSGEELQRLRGLSLGETVKNIPGVSALQSGPTVFKPVVQGMYGTRVLVMNNGIRQEGQQWGNEHAPEVDPFIASNITVIKGAQSIRYGSDAIGGVILLQPEPLNTFLGTKAVINLGGFSNNRAGVASGIVEHGVKAVPGLAFRAQGSARKGGNAHTPDYWLGNTAFQELNFSLAGAYTHGRWGVETFYSQFNTQLGIFSGSHIGNVTDLLNAIQSGRPADTSGFSYDIGRPKQVVNHELWKTGVFYQIGRNRIVIDYARQYNKRQEYDSHRAYNSGLQDGAELLFELTTHNIQAAFEHTAGKLKGVGGVSYIHQSNTYEGRFFIPNFRSNAIGIYLTESYKVSAKTKAEAGIRYDYKFLTSYYYEKNILQSPERSFRSPTVSLGIEHHFSTHLNMQAVVASAFRPPNVNELYSNGVHHGAAAYETGNKNLQSERSYNLALTLNYSLGKCWGYVHTYGYYFHDYIYLKPVFPPVLTIRGAFPAFEYTQVNATYGGFDVALNDSITSHLIYSTRFSMVSAYDRTQQDWLVYIPPTRWQHSVKYLFRSGSRLIKPYVSLECVLVAQKRNVLENADYAAPPAGYALLQAEAGAQIRLGKQEMQLTVTAQNLLNSRYRDYMDRFRYYADAAGRNIILRLQIPLDFTKK